MKNFKIKFCLITLLGIMSCDNTLDLDPQDDLTSTVIFSNKSLALGAVNGMYSRAQGASVLSGTYDAMSEWQSDNVNFVGSFPTFNDIKIYNTFSDNSSTYAIWRRHYELINQANMVIKNIPLVPDTDGSFPQNERDDLVGQALFMRALAHFRLSQCFGVQYKQNPNGLSIPYQTLPFTGTITYPSRKTISEVYSLIEADLKIAELTIENLDRHKATASAAKALLARLYLYKEDWTNAANYANEVINLDNSSLSPNYSFYNSISNQEHVFVLSTSTGDGASDNSGDGGVSYSKLFNGIQFNGRGDCPFSQDLKNLFLATPGDLRFSATLTRTGTNAIAATDLFTRKYPNGSTNIDDPNVIRISEMFLIRAEANLRGGTLIGGNSPAVDASFTRLRAGLPAFAVVTLTDILDERRKEFCFEGLRRMDLLRNNLSLRPIGDINHSNSLPNQPKVIFPIPQRERDNNTNLVQNLGY